ncbi:Myc-type, basic helix-loop-helix [Sesbania bispinosa]|nr:Myc-type, basic helix-loop-helix [Sesbania bispinosa]
MASMDESWEKLLSDLEMDDSHLLSEYNVEEELIINEENSLQYNWEVQSCIPNFTTESESTFVAVANSNTMEDNSSLEENTDFGLKHVAAFAEEPTLFSSSMSYTLSFEQSIAVPNKETCQKHDHDEQSKEIREELRSRKSKRCRSSSQTQDHIIAERKRRENLTKLFIELSAIIPGLKKIDKASIVNNTIDYVKYLQKSVKDLEERNMKRKTESVACFKNDKSSVVVADDSEPTKRFPIVEARVSAKDVLFRVMCEKQKDIIIKLLAKLKAHNLSVLCSNVLPFGNSTLNINIIAQVDHKGFSMTMDDLVENVIKDLLGC